MMSDVEEELDILNVRMCYINVFYASSSKSV